MPSNSFGEILRMTTWGESHGKAVGVVIDGFPSNFPINLNLIQEEVNRRAPGKTPWTSPRRELDQFEVLSGIFEGKTTGAPISLIIWNKNCDSGPYEEVKFLHKPGHASYTYKEKYQHFDHRGSGRASARETVCRVLAGAFAKQLLSFFGAETFAFLRSISTHKSSTSEQFSDVKEKTFHSPIFCPDKNAEKLMCENLSCTHREGDSLGGVVECWAEGLKVGLGDPVYQKLEARLATAMLSIPASKGFEIGRGFDSTRLTGSEHNDQMQAGSDAPKFLSNYSGGTLGGISNGERIIFRTAFKPTSSISKVQKTIDANGSNQVFELPVGSKHDPCVAIRAAPVVSAMAAFVFADTLLSRYGQKIMSKEEI